jgi:hypothetical protein
VIEISLHCPQHARQRQLLTSAEWPQARSDQSQGGRLGQRGHVVARIRQIGIIQHHKAVRLIKVAECQ